LSSDHGRFVFLLPVLSNCFSRFASVCQPGVDEDAPDTLAGNLPGVQIKCIEEIITIFVG
jgi:hypothetical protein